MGEPNPNGCCGVSTACCPDNKVPDTLIATVQSHCGSYTIELNVRECTALELCWTGDGTFECSQGCDTNDLLLELWCDLNASWVLHYGCTAVNEAGDPTSEQCSPFNMVWTLPPGEGCNCGGEDITVTITE